MATRTTIQYIDDLTGEVYEEGQTLYFEVGGVGYTIDLAAENVDDFFKHFEKYTSVASRVSKKSAKRPAGRQAVNGTSQDYPAGVTPAQVREWAARNGIEVTTRGRVPNDVIAKYIAAN